MTEQDVIFDDEDDDGLAAESATEKSGKDFEVEARYRLSPLTLTVFKRENNGSVFRNYNLQRTYAKDDDGDEFGHTESLRPRDLRKAGRLLVRAADDVEGLEVDTEI